MKFIGSIRILTSLSIVLLVSSFADACRLNSELMKGYARRTVERLLASHQFGSIYWPDEPLPVESLSKAIGIDISQAETHFKIGIEPRNDKQNNEVAGSSNSEAYENVTNSLEVSLVQDVFVSCSIDRDRSYSLSINLELDNPFKVIDVYYEGSQDSSVKKGNTSEENYGGQGGRNGGGGGAKFKKNGLFRIHLPQSSLLVQLNQKIRYDECLRVNYVQLAPSVNYELECVECDKSEQEFFDKIFTKRMSQLDAELDATLSEKVLFGLQVLLSQQRLDLDTYLD